jgi:hypothetical protein
LVVELEVPGVAVHGTAEHVVDVLSKAFHEIASSERIEAHVEGVEGIVGLRVVVIVISRSKVWRLLLLVSKLEMIDLLWHSSAVPVGVVLLGVLVAVGSVGAVNLGGVGELVADSVAELELVGGVGVELEVVVVAVEAGGEGGLDGADGVEVAVEGQGDCRVVDDEGVAVAVDGDDHLGPGDAHRVEVPQYAQMAGLLAQRVVLVIVKNVHHYMEA